MTQSQLMTVEVLPQSKLMREVAWPGLLMVEVMYVSKNQTKMAVVMMLS